MKVLFFIVRRQMLLRGCLSFSSRYEGLGLVLVEAPAAGLPCEAPTGVPEEVAITSLVRFLLWMMVW